VDRAVVNFEGEYYRTVNATIYDRPDQPVPIYVGAVAAGREVRGRSVMD